MRTRRRSRAGPSSCSSTTRLRTTARTAADGVYRMSGVEPNYATADTYELRFRRPGAVATTALLGRAHSVFTNDLQRITRHRRAVGQQSAEPEPADRSERHRLRRAVAGSDRGSNRDAGRTSGAALPSACFYDPNAAEPGHAARRLLQVRPELRRPRLPERGQLSAASDAAVRDVPARCVRHHSAAIDCGDGRVRRADVPGVHRRRRAGDGATLRSGALGAAAVGVRRAAHRRHELLPASHVRLEPRAGLEPDLSTTTFRSTSISTSP